MKTEVLRITPVMAAKMLRQNKDNRPIRRTIVENLKTAYSRGEYVMSHQGIAFSGDKLVDGQHRLTAISEMPPQFHAEMLVFHGVDPKAAKVMDIGYKRTASDILGEERKVVECARFLAAMYEGRPNAITPTYLAPFVARIRDLHADLMSLCPTACRTWSSAPVRAAVVMVGLAGGDLDYAKLVYRAMVQQDFTTMPTSVQSLFRAHMHGKVRASLAPDIFVRALKIFNPVNAKLTKIQVSDTAPALEIVRGVLRKEVFGVDVKKKGNGASPLNEI